MKPMRLRQRGATLLVSLIFLVLMTLFAVTAFNMGKTSLQAVGNMQQRNQTLVAAQEAINDAISSTKFIDTPTTLLSNNSNEMKVDINGDGKDDVEVKIKPPVCVKSRNVPKKELSEEVKNLPIDSQREWIQEYGTCLGHADQIRLSIFDVSDPNLPKSDSDPSFCAEGLWEIEATAKDILSEVTVTVTQGVGVRVPDAGDNGIAVVCK